MFDWIMSGLWGALAVGWLVLWRKSLKENAINRAHNAEFAQYPWHRPIRMMSTKDKFLVGAMYVGLSVAYFAAAVS